MAHSHAFVGRSHGRRLPGDFVEYGVNTGIFSLAICDYIDFNATGKHFCLFDTFDGIPPEQISSEEKKRGHEKDNSLNYSEYFDTACRNFAPYSNAHLVRGRVPQTLESVAIEQVRYLSLDINIVAPEIAAIRYFWPRLSSGAPVVLDDYA